MKRPEVDSVLDFFGVNDQLSGTQKQVVSTVREFVTKEVAPIVRECYRREEFPISLATKLGELGLLGATLSGYGLPGVDYLTYGLTMRELERCDSGLRSFASVQGALVMYPIHAFGSEEQKSTWLARLGKGEAVGCFGLTESFGGSDPAAMRTVARRVDGGWSLSGSKAWITNGDISDVAVVWAKTDGEIRGFLVPKEAKGFKRVRTRNKMSMRASVTSELFFDEVRLPADAILPGSAGLKSTFACLNLARFGIAWGVLGAAEACFEEARQFALGRTLFGGPLAGKQLAQRKLALMASAITRGQLLALRLAQLKDTGQLHPSQVSMAKQSNVEMALECARTARDILGASGISDEFASMRHLCNLETVVTYEGTSDVHLLVVGRELTGLASFSGPTVEGE